VSVTRDKKKQRKRSKLLSSGQDYCPRSARSRKRGASKAQFSYQQTILDAGQSHMRNKQIL